MARYDLRTLVIGVVLVFLLSACGQDRQVDVDPPTAAAVAEPGTDWEDLNLDLDHLRGEQQEMIARQFMIENPEEVETIRFTSVFDHPYAVVDCLERAGHHGFEVSQGGIIFDGEAGSAETTEARQYDWYICSIQYMVDPRVTMVKMPYEAAVRQFDYQTEILVPCLERVIADEDIPAVLPSPSSKQAWLDAYYSDTGMWDPFSAFSNQHQLELAHAACPQFGPDVFPEPPAN